jgi:hypothetical protein
MAGVITNIIKTIFTTSGADDAVGATDRLGRAQTRLGNASAGNGRQFAAQASGLGGLVGAYAGAAATVFALQAAFSALANAARAEQTFQGLNALASSVGVNGQALAASVRDLTNSQLTLTEAASQINLGISAGFSTTQIEGLTGVAMKASRALGRDLTDSMTRVVRGSAKMEAELLDELGIYTKIEPATRAYAASIGKSVSSLSEFERRQAFANAVIAEGERKFSSINTTIPTTAEKIEAFGAKILDLTTQLGILTANTLAPLADFLTNNVAAAFSVLGIAISLAAGKGIQVLSAGFSALTASITNAGLSAENFVRKITGIQGTAANASTAIKTLTADMLRLNDAEKARFAAIQGTAAVRNLSKSEIKESNALINKSITAIRSEISAEETRRNTAMAALNASSGNVAAKRADFEAAKANVRTLQQQGASTAALTTAQSQLASAQGKLGAATAAFNSVQANNISTVTASRAAILGLNADVARLNTTLASTIPAATGARAAIAGFLAASTRVVASVATGFTGLFTGIIGAASKLFFLTSIITLIGSSFANAIGKGEEFQALLKRIGEAAKGIFSNTGKTKAKNAIQGITAANLAELEKTDSALRDIDSFTFKKKILGFEVDVTKTKEELASEVTSLLAQASQGFKKTIAESATSGKAIGAAIGGNILGPLLRFIPVIGPVIGTLLGRTIGTAIGAGIGTIWDYFTEVPPIPEELATKIRSQFADSLRGLDDDIQDKLVTVLGTLEQRYGSAARFDPAARAALKTQQKLVLEGGKYLNDIEAVSELMLATGQTADKIVKNFQFDDAERQVSYISLAFTKLAGKPFTFKFIDLQDESLKKLTKMKYQIEIPASLNFEGVDSEITDTAMSALPAIYASSNRDMDKSLQILKDTLSNTFNAPEDVTSIDNLITKLKAMPTEELFAVSKGFKTLQKPIEEATGAYNSYNQAALRSLEVQRELYNEAYSGNITAEGFTQGISNSKQAIIEAERGYFAVTQQIRLLEAELAKIKDPDIAAGLSQYIKELKIAQIETDSNLITQREITKELLAQENVIKNIATLSGFFKSFAKEAKNALTLELEFATVGSENPLATQIGYLSQFVTATEEEIRKYSILSEQLEPLALSDSEKQKILTTPLEDAQTLAMELNDAGKGFSATVTGLGLRLTTNLGKEGQEATESLYLLEGSAGKLAETTIAAAEAITQLVRQAVENLPQYLDEKTKEIATIISDSKKEIASIAKEEILLSIKFESNKAEILRDIEIIKQQSIIEQLELDLDLSKAKVDSGKLTEMQGVAEENTLRQKLLQEQRDLITIERDNELAAIEDRRELMIAESDGRLAAIREEAAAQVKVLTDNLAYVNGLAVMYQAVVTAMDSSADRQVTGIIQAGNSVSDSWATTLKSGATALNSAIVAGLAKSTQFTNDVEGASAQIPDLSIPSLTAVTDKAKEFAETTAKGIEAIGLAEAARIEAEEKARKRAGELLDRESEKALANYNARIAANDKLGLIESENAIAREKKAKEEAEKDKKKDEKDKFENRMAEMISSFNGAVESAFMSLYNLALTGEGSIKEIIGGLFQSIAEEVYKQTIATPLSNIISSWLGGAVQKLTGGTDIVGSSLQGVVGSAAGATGDALLKNPIGDKAADAGAKAITDMGTKMSGALNGVGATVNAAANAGATAIQGTGNILATTTRTSTGVVATANTAGATTLMSSLGPILAVLAVIAAIIAIFGGKKGGGSKSNNAAEERAKALAQSNTNTFGSIPQMASGGMMRDRVPALLEPGEFVIRKPIARKIGASNLAAMNATGKTQAPATTVNIKNEGTQKDAQASPPRFDGDKYVIDIIMRDLSTNGPIRRTLRGGV